MRHIFHRNTTVVVIKSTRLLSFKFKNNKDCSTYYFNILQNNYLKQNQNFI